MEDSLFAAIFLGVLQFGLLMYIFLTFCLWKLFIKADKPGWAALIPIYNIIVMIKIADKPVWWTLLLLIPLVNIVIAIVLLNLFVRAYGKSSEFTVGTIFFPYVFLPILIFDGSYKGN